VPNGSIGVIRMLDSLSKAIGVLAALLGLAGYVIVIGSVILWLRLNEVHLPPEVPVALATREELIVLGAKAVAVWLALAAALVGLGTWIVTGDPERRRFGYGEATLALAMTLSTLLALSTDRAGLLALPGAAALIVIVGGLIAWPSLEAVGAAVLPAIVGTMLAVALAAMHNGNDAATAVGATAIFVVLTLATPSLQTWRSRQEANRAARVRLEIEDKDEEEALAPLIAALGGEGHPRPSVLTWVQRGAIAALILVLIGAAAVASQLDRDENFHKVLVSLTNGDCLVGTFVTRGTDQLIIAEAGAESVHRRVTVIPTKEVLEVQVYGSLIDGKELVRDEGCISHGDRLVKPPPQKPA
jgi:hypothetical protein